MFCGFLHPSSIPLGCEIFSISLSFVDIRKIIIDLEVADLDNNQNIINNSSLLTDKLPNVEKSNIKINIQNTFRKLLLPYIGSKLLNSKRYNTYIIF